MWMYWTVRVWNWGQHLCSSRLQSKHRGGLFLFFHHAEPFEEISKHSQSALHVLSCVQCKGFPPPFSLQPFFFLCFCLSAAETYCLAKEQIHRHKCGVHHWSHHFNQPLSLNSVVLPDMAQYWCLRAWFSSWIILSLGFDRINKV